jgi:hypothetical protein
MHWNKATGETDQYIIAAREAACARHVTNSPIGTYYAPKRATTLIKKENIMFLIYKELQMGSGCKVIYEEGLPNI